MGKPWFQQELEKQTREKWLVTSYEDRAVMRCQHGMSILIPFPKGLDRAFLNRASEGSFVGGVLPAHRPWTEVPTPYKELGLI